MSSFSTEVLVDGNAIGSCQPAALHVLVYEHVKDVVQNELQLVRVRGTGAVDEDLFVLLTISQQKLVLDEGQTEIVVLHA